MCRGLASDKSSWSFHRGTAAHNTPVRCARRRSAVHHASIQDGDGPVRRRWARHLRLGGEQRACASQTRTPPPPPGRKPTQQSQPQPSEEPGLLEQEFPTSRLTGSCCQISGGIRLEIKCTISVTCLIISHLASAPLVAGTAPEQEFALFHSLIKISFASDLNSISFHRLKRHLAERRLLGWTHRGGQQRLPCYSFSLAHPVLVPSCSRLSTLYY